MTAEKRLVSQADKLVFAIGRGTKKCTWKVTGQGGGGEAQNNALQINVKVFLAAKRRASL